MSVREVIVVAGLSASGKSTLAGDIARKLDAPVVRMDDYYRDISDFGAGLSVDDLNWDDPAMFHLDEFACDLAGLRAGRLESVPDYCFGTSTRVGRKPVGAGRVTVVEGQFALCAGGARESATLTVYVDLCPEEALRRRLERDVCERGRDEQSILRQWHEHVLPAWREHVLPTMDLADIVVRGDFDRGGNLELVMAARSAAPAYIA